MATRAVLACPNRGGAVRPHPRRRTAAPRQVQSRRPHGPPRPLVLILVPPQFDALVTRAAAGHIAGPAQATVGGGFRRAAIPGRERRAPAPGPKADVRLDRRSSVRVGIRVGEPVPPLGVVVRRTGWVRRAGQAGQAAILSGGAARFHERLRRQRRCRAEQGFSRAADAAAEVVAVEMEGWAVRTRVPACRRDGGRRRAGGRAGLPAPVGAGGANKALCGGCGGETPRGAGASGGWEAGGRDGSARAMGGPVVLEVATEGKRGRGARGGRLPWFS